MKGDRYDPKALIREAYRIDGISAPECRSIFLDWALSLPDDLTVAEALAELITRHAAGAPEHPMSGVLHEGLASPITPARRGGRRGRHGGDA